MSTTSELKVLHDRLLDLMPAEAKHNPDTCPLCALEDVDNHATERGGLMPETFTQEDLDAAVAAAKGDLQKRLDELEAQAKETEVGRAVAEARVELESKIAELQDQLDTAVAGQTSAETKLTETEQYWANAVAEQEAAAALAEAKEARVAAAKEAGALPDDYIDANADRFAAMSAEDFDARIAEWKVVATAAKAVKTPDGAPPAKTVLEAQAIESNGSKLSFLTEMREQHFDPRTLGGVS